ncbi:MAG: hypothetical protein R3D58_04355 [Saprospiraceae bacterium]
MKHFFTPSLQIVPAIFRIRAIAMLILTMSQSPVSAQPATASGQLHYQARGTGRTTGHVITLDIYNPSPTPLRTTVGDCFIPSTAGYQGYVVLKTYTVEVPALGAAQLQLDGYCTNVRHPALPDGEPATAVSNWVPWAEAAALPQPGADPGAGFIPVENFRTDDPLSLTYPGTQTVFPYRIDFNRHPYEAARLLLHAAAAAELAFDQLMRDGLLQPARWGRSDAGIREQLVQQALWAYTGQLEGNGYGKQDFDGQLTEEAEQELNQGRQDFPPETRQALDRQVQDVWAGISLVGASAKLIAADQQHHDAIFQETPAGPPVDPLDLLPGRINAADPAQPGADRQLLPALLFFQKNAPASAFTSLQQLAESKWENHLRHVQSEIRPGDADALPRLLVLAGKLNFPASRVIDENKQKDLLQLLQSRLNAVLEQQLDALNPAGPDYLQRWRRLKCLEREAWYARLAPSNPLRKLPRIGTLRPAGGQFAPSRIPLASPKWKHQFDPPGAVEPQKFPWWIPAAAVPVAGGVVYALLRNKNKGNPSSPVALADALNLPCKGEGSVNVLANDSGTGITVTAVSAPPQVTATILGGVVQISSNNTGVYDVSYGITDVAGQTAIGTIRVTVTDQVPPTINCPAAVTLEGCTEPPPPTLSGQATAADGCDPAPEIHFVDELGGTPCMTMFHRSWISTDASGNTASCLQEITLHDQTAPVLTYCPPAVSVNFGQQTDLSLTGQAAATDNCTVPLSPTFTDDNSSLNDCTGAIIRIWTAADACGNTTTCTQSIAVKDGTSPVFTLCPPAVAVDCGSQNDLSLTGQATATDDCTGTVTPAFSDDLGGFNGCTGVIVRNWTVTDAVGNMASCVQNIQVADTAAPVFDNCPADITVALGQQNDLTITGQAAATDACTPAVTVSFEDDLSGLTDCGGTISRLWLATDGCSNSAECKQSIVVTDPVPPEFTYCPPAISVECGQQDDLTLTGQAEATDNCVGAVAPNFTDDPATFTGCFGDILRQWIATDPGGNSAVCEQVISVQDKTPPVFSNCPETVTVACGMQNDLAITGQAQASDACNGAGMPTYSDDLGGFSGCEGVILRIWTSADSCGNAATCEQKISVFDDVPPVFTLCPPTVFVNCGQENNLNFTGMATAEDACSGTVQVSFSDDLSQFSNCEGSITRSWTGNDLCGNAVTCAQLIFVSAAPCGLTVNFQTGPATCGNCTGTAMATVQPPGTYTFNWSDGQSGPNAVGLCPGTYAVSIHDPVNSCTEIFNIDIPDVPVLSLLVLNVTPPSSPSANDGSVVLQVQPPTAALPLQVFVDDQFIGLANSTFQITNFSAGTYTIFVVDANGCPSEPITVELSPGPEPEFFRANAELNIQGISAAPPGFMVSRIAENVLLPEHPNTAGMFWGPPVGLTVWFDLGKNWQLRLSDNRRQGLLAFPGLQGNGLPIRLDFTSREVAFRQHNTLKNRVIGLRETGIAHLRLQAVPDLTSGLNLPAKIEQAWQFFVGGGLQHPVLQHFQLEWAGRLYINPSQTGWQFQPALQLQIRPGVNK